MLDIKIIAIVHHEIIHFPFSFFLGSGVVGSGICILSRYPIYDVMFHKWPLNGYVHKIHHGDWFGGKGVGLCKIKILSMNINVYTAHVRLFNALFHYYFHDI